MDAQQVLITVLRYQNLFPERIIGSLWEQIDSDKVRLNFSLSDL
jgi:hypothetical protein